MTAEVSSLPMAVRDADAPSFEAIYAEHARFVWRSLVGLGLQDADARDAMQEVFLVVHEKLATYERRSKMTSWLYGICINVVSNKRRRAHVRREVVDVESLAEGRAGAEDPEAELAKKERAVMLERILSTMPLEQRAVFVLFELEGYAATEIAEMVGAPVATIHSRLRLAREAFARGAARLRARARHDEGHEP